MGWLWERGKTCQQDEKENQEEYWSFGNADLFQVCFVITQENSRIERKSCSPFLRDHALGSLT